MCSFVSIEQNRLLPPFEPAIESSFSLGEDQSGCGYPALAALVQKNEMQGPPFSFERGNAFFQNKEIIQQNEKGPSEMSLELYKGYLNKRISETSSKPVSTRQLFKEITDRGYRGTIGEMQICVSMIRKNNRLPEESFQFHKEYIKKRLEQAASKSVSPRQLFEEIKANGYAGAYSTVVSFVSIIREKKGPEASFQFHKEYVKKRLEQAASESVSIEQLFEEIKAQGYQGNFRTMQTFASMIRTSRAPEKSRAPEESFAFHKEYIKKRLGEAAPTSVSTKQLFAEIKAKGYQGKLSAVQTFASMIRTNGAPEASLAFHKEYIQKRLEQAAPKSVLTRKLFEEMRANGYLGAYSTLVTYLSGMRKKKHKRPEESLQFHKEYITKRLEQAASESVSIRQLFEEIKANGYLGSYNTVKAFVSTIREKKHKRLEESLQFHKEYITKRIKEAASTKELFEEIIVRGYRGTLKTMQIFLSTIRTSRPPEASLQLYKGYIKKRIEEAAPESIRIKQLFKEIRANGYLGAYSTVKAFVSTIRTSKSPVASLAFHKEYIRNRLGEAASKSIPAKKIFEEMRANGYLGAYSTILAFVSTLREKKRPEASIQFYKGYIKKRVEEAVSESISAKQLFEEIKANGYLGAYSTVVTFLSNLRKKKGPEASLEFHKEYIQKRLEKAASESISPRQLLEEIKAKGYQGTLRPIQKFVSMIRISSSPKASL